MADELTLRVSLSFEKGSTEVDLAMLPTTFDVAGSNALKNRQSVGTSEEAILAGDVAAGGYFFGINRDDTNFLELRAGSGLADLIRLKPGDPCLFRITDDATLYGIADTAACELEYAIIDA